MSYKPVPHSFLLKTSVKDSVLYGANSWNFPGSRITINPNTITFAKQLKSRAEVVQVQTIGGDLYTPTASTAYTVLINDPNRHSYGGTQPQIKFSYVTPPVITTLGATAALQREGITAQLVTAINNATNTIFATAASLTGGAGFTITDSGGYYGANGPRPAGGPTILGANQIYAQKNADGTGFIDANTRVVTTAAVYAFGVGATLLADKAVIDGMFGNVISGTITPGSNGQTIPSPLDSTGASAVSGQNYDAFIFSSLVLSGIPNATTVQGYNIQQDAVFVDNGTGTSTTNLTGFLAFEKNMLRGIFSLYEQAPSAMYDFFDQAVVMSATYPTTGAAVSTTDNVVMAAQSTVGMNSNTWFINPIGTHTLIAPIVTTAGLIPQLDITTQEGLELSAPNLTQCPKELVVGKTEGSFYARVTFTGIAATDWKTLSVGFRKKAAYAVDQTAYEAASVATACLGVPLDTGVAPVINTITGPGTAGALTNTSTTVAPTAASSHDLLITVNVSGVVKFYVNGVDRTPAAGYTFTAGLILMPFISFRNGANVSATPAIIQTAFLPTITWRG